MKNLTIKEFDKYVEKNKMIVRKIGEIRIGAEDYYWELYDKTTKEFQELVSGVNPNDHEHFKIIHKTLKNAVNLAATRMGEK